jgi:hypothetical protein
MFKKNSKLNTIQRKYCSCLVKVRSKKNSPYGICTNSVYGSRKMKRRENVKCSKTYKFTSLTKIQLINLAIEKKIKVNKKMNRSHVMSLIRKKIYKD